jgi:hypothetical protein
MAQLSRRCEASAGGRDEGGARWRRSASSMSRLSLLLVAARPSRPNPKRPVASNTSEPGSGVDGAPDPEKGAISSRFHHQEALRRGAGADQLCAVVVDTQEITVVGGDEQMPVPIHCGLAEFVAGVRIRKRGNGCPARGVELVYFVTAVEDDVVSRWVEGETMGPDSI